MARTAEQQLAYDKAAECIELIEYVRQGVHPASIVPVVNSVTEWHIYLLKVMANASGATAVQYAQYEPLFTAEQVSALLGITVQDAQAWKDKVAALLPAQQLIFNYTSGMHFLDVVS